MANYDWDKVSRGYDPETSWTGNYFMEYWSATILYFFIDLLWVARVPICVKSPGVIIKVRTIRLTQAYHYNCKLTLFLHYKHHFIAIFYLIAPLAWPRFRWFMGACLSVEVNTWFLIARRVVYKRNYSNTLGGNLISICFYLSWIIIRCLVYPGLLYMFLHMAEEGIRETGTIMHWELLFVPIHFFLCLLNLKWTYDLFQPMFVRWVDKEKGPIQGVASGL